MNPELAALLEQRTILTSQIAALVNLGPARTPLQDSFLRMYRINLMGLNGQILILETAIVEPEEPPF